VSTRRPTPAEQLLRLRGERLLPPSLILHGPVAPDDPARRHAAINQSAAGGDPNGSNKYR